MGPVRTIFWVPIVRSFRTWPSRTHDTTPDTTWLWGVCSAPPRRITHINLGAGYSPLFVCPDVRRGHRQTIFSRSLGAPSRSRTNGQGIRTHGFPSRRGYSCMIVYMTPLRSKYNFSLYEPIIQLEKNGQVINDSFYQVDKK